MWETDNQVRDSLFRFVDVEDKDALKKIIDIVKENVKHFRFSGSRSFKVSNGTTLELKYDGKGQFLTKFWRRSWNYVTHEFFLKDMAK